MDTIKNILIDGFNGMSLNAIPFFIFQLLAAAAMGWTLQLVLNKKLKESKFKNGVIMAFSICLIVALSKFMLPFSILAAAAILLLLSQKKNTLFTFIMAIVGVGCGIGSVIPMAIALVLFVVILLFVPLEDTDNA